MRNKRHIPAEIVTNFVAIRDAYRSRSLGLLYHLRSIHRHDEPEIPVLVNSIYLVNADVVHRRLHAQCRNGPPSWIPQNCGDTVKVRTSR